MHYYILLGSNIGNSKAYIEKAKFLLSKEVTIDLSSSLYRTAPWGETKQDYFINQVLQISTGTKPTALMSQIESI
jgi:2-amino-4-hydroxy-6-hydroxymethyldihydropteridine diphosphokinase